MYLYLIFQKLFQQYNPKEKVLLHLYIHIFQNMIGSQSVQNFHLQDDNHRLGHSKGMDIAHRHCQDRMRLIKAFSDIAIMQEAIN